MWCNTQTTMTQCPACEKTVEEGARFCPFCGAQMVVVQSAGEDPYLGKLVGGKYLVERLLGEGGMGRVYQAVQQPLEKTVVLKVLRASLQGDASLVARFQREARAASRLSHPNSISVTDFGQMEDGALYIAMEYLQGRDLAQELAEVGPFSEERLVHVMSQVLSALGEAHESGVIHRDLKPENVMLVPRRDDPDHVKVLDFGIAKLQDVGEGPDAVALTQAGLVCGTPEYMSPEQARGEALDARSDIYAIGVLMYQLATGELPFQADSSIGIVTKHLTETPVPPRQVAPSISPSLEAVILRCMAKDPGARPATAEALREELRSARPQARDEAAQSFAASPPPPVAPPAPDPSGEALQGHGGAEPPPPTVAEPAGDLAAARSSGPPPPPVPARPSMPPTDAGPTTEGTWGADVPVVSASPRSGGVFKVVLGLCLLLGLPAGAGVGYLAWSGTLSEWLGKDEAPDSSEQAVVDAVAEEAVADAGPTGEEGLEQAEPDDRVVSDEPADDALASDPETMEPEREESDGPAAPEEIAADDDDATDETPEVGVTEPPARKVAAAETPGTTERKAAASQRRTTAARRTSREATSRTTPATRGRTAADTGRTPESSRTTTAPRQPRTTDSTRAGAGAQDPARARILASTAERHWGQGDFERALALYRQAAQLDRTEPTYQRQIGLALISLGRESQAVPPLRRYLQMAPDASDRPMIERLIRQHGG